MDKQPRRVEGENDIPLDPVSCRTHSPLSLHPLPRPAGQWRDVQEAMVARFEETGIAMGDPDADLDALLEEQAALQAKIEDADAWNLQARETTCIRLGARGSAGTKMSV